MKLCNKCKVRKPIHKFVKNGNNTYRPECKNCYNSNWKYRIISGIRNRSMHRVRPNGKTRNLIYRDKIINGKFLQKLRDQQNGLCYWLKIPIDFEMQDKLRKASLDRLDNSKGYIIDNVVLTTVFANTGRRDATVKEMRKFLKNYFKLNIKNHK